MSIILTLRLLEMMMAPVLSDREAGEDIGGGYKSFSFGCPVHPMVADVLATNPLNRKKALPLPAVLLL